MNHTLKNRLSKLESSCKVVHESFAHWTDEELLRELERMQSITDEIFASKSSDDPEIIRFETELAELDGVTLKEWRAMRLERFLQKQENNR